jgi:hypothetical protein
VGDVKVAALVVVGVIVAAAVAWYAAELHYENCVSAATAAHPLGEAGLTAKERESQNPFDTFRDGEPPPEVTGRPLERRRAAIDGCSRLP